MKFSDLCLQVRDLQKEVEGMKANFNEDYSGPSSPAEPIEKTLSTPETPTIERDVSYLSEEELKLMLERGYIPLGLAEQPRDGDFGWWTGLGSSTLIDDIVSETKYSDVFGWEMSAEKHNMSPPHGKDKDGERLIVFRKTRKS